MLISRNQHFHGVAKTDTGASMMKLGELDRLPSFLRGEGVKQFSRLSRNAVS